MKASAPALLAVRNSTENEPHGAFVTRVPENTGTLLSVMPTRNGWPPRLLSTSISSRIRPSSPLAFNAQVLPAEQWPAARTSPPPPWANAGAALATKVAPSESARIAQARVRFIVLLLEAWLASDCRDPLTLEGLR